MKWNTWRLCFQALCRSRASGATSVGLQPTGSSTFSTNDVTFVELLPTDEIALQLDNHWLPFVLDLDGSFHVAPAQARFVRFDRFHGLARMTVLAPLP